MVTLEFLFSGGLIACENAADANDDGSMDIADAIALLGYLFSGQPAPPVPFIECGLDPTDDPLACETYNSCP